VRSTGISPHRQARGAEVDEAVSERDGCKNVRDIAHKWGLWGSQINVHLLSAVVGKLLTAITLKMLKYT
jgi:hypothetical protein